MTTVPELLNRSIAIYEERRALYGDNYLHIGKVLAGFFPRGITLKTEEEFNRFHLFLHKISKMSRDAMVMPQSIHEDSLLDLINYAAMAIEAEEKIAHPKE